MAIAPITAQETKDEESGDKKKVTPEGLELSSGEKTELRLRLAFPMYFGESVLLGADYLGPWAGTSHGEFLQTKIYQNFVYNLEMASLHMTSKKSPLDVSLGLRWSFMDFSLANTGISFTSTDGAASPYMPSTISTAGYDGKKSKIHASYIGVPLRLAIKIGDRGKIFAGVAGEYLVKGYTKFRSPNTRTTTNGLFSTWRASVEGGLSYAGWGIWASYGFTPLFLPECSNARTLSFGIVMGI